MAKKVIIIGGIGNGSVIAEAIEEAFGLDSQEVQLAGYLNDREPVGSSIERFPVLGKLEDINQFLNDPTYYFINTILRIEGNDERVEMFSKLDIPDERMFTFIHPSVYYPSSLEIGHGSVVMPNCSISSGVKIKNNSLIMVSCTLGHNSTIHNFCHIAAASCIGSNVNLYDRSHVGLNSTIKEQCSIGENSTLGMGSVLTKNIPANEIWLGVPAKHFKSL